jgi:hypothetical protein
MNYPISIPMLNIACRRAKRVWHLAIVPRAESG